MTVMNKFIIAEINSFHRSGILEADTVQEMFSPILEVRGFESFINDEAALGPNLPCLLNATHRSSKVLV